MVHQTSRPKADVPGPHRTRPYLVFSLDGALFGVEISQVRQISWIGRIWRLPCQPDCVKGVTILGDRVVTLIDLRLKLGLPEIAYHAHTCVVEVDGSIPVAIVVDSVERVSHF
ncbi:MAG: chemotaxis protein CheW, partial [Planctomycetes bacterium]|nr:chemotaxis protein CheW [Planctomycetota bacterium]